MLYAIKRLALGVSLIALASAALLISDLGRRVGTASSALRVAILQHASSVILDDGLRGTLEALAERGFRDGERIKIERFNAQGDMPTGIAIASQVASGNYDLVITSSTPSMQAVANNNREGKVRHVFTLVADPFASGVGLNRKDPLDHPSYMVGQGIFPPVETAFQIARRMLPGLASIGVAWNPAEANSLAFVTKAREVAAELNLTLLEANVDNTASVSAGINSLTARGAQAIWVGGDNTVVAGITTVIDVAQRNRVPVFTILPGAPDRGTLFDAGPDFYQVGRQGGFLAADVLEGGDIQRIPIRDIQDLVPPYLSVNTKALRGLREPWRVPDDVLANASVVVDDSGIRRKAADVSKASPVKKAEARPASTTGKVWRVNLVQLNQTLDVEESERGVLDGLRESGLVEGRDFEKTIRNAHGDMPTLSAMVDAAVSDRADLIISFSTPTLQAALQRAGKTPVVFTYVADAITAGAGKSDTDHVSNVTGVYLIGAYDQMMPLVRQVLPQARALGTVFVPAEVNMVTQLAIMEKAVRGAGMTLTSVAANSASEVQDAALALIANRVDAICQLPGNLTAAAFPSIVQAARRARVPMFVFQTSQVRAGAVIAVARDYYESGRESGKMAARVMRGESPGSIPFAGFSGTRLLVNLPAAREARLTIPRTIIDKADEVIGK
jgi:ABC-type uncharacterized transport system substrate-binding protein